MTIIDTLVTDRTTADTARRDTLAAKGWKAMTTDERVEWLSDIKGEYRATDLNRVGEALLYLMDRLNGYGYVVTITPRMDWAIGEIPAPADLKHYLDDVATIRAVMELPPTTPDVPPDMDRLTLEEANDIERILAAVEKNINQVAGAFRRSNAPSFWSGSEPLPTAQSDLGRTWEELDAMGTTWENWEVADWYLLLYGNLKAEGEVDDGV